MTKSVSFILLAFVMAMSMLASCGRSEASRQLAAADAVIEDTPDSALRILESIDTSTLRKERDIHLRELLLAQARVKLDYENIDTVPLARAQKFFAAHPEKNYRLRSNFYMGYIGYLDSCFLSAINYMADSFLEASDPKDSYWLAKSAEAISHIVYNCGFKNEGLRFDSVAISEYTLAGKELNSIYSQIDLGINLMVLKRYEEADILFNKTIKKLKAEYPNDSDVLLYALRPAVRTKILRDDYSGAEQLLDIILQYSDGKPSTAFDISYYSLIAIHKGDYRKASQILDSLNGLNLNNYDSSLIALAKNRLANAIKDSSLMISTSSKIISSLEEENSFSYNNPVGIVLQNKIADHKNKSISRYRFNVSVLLIILLFLIPFILDSLVGLYFKRKKIIEFIKEIRYLEKKLFENDLNYMDLRNKLVKQSVETNNLKNEKRKYSKNLTNTIKKTAPIQNILLETLGDINGSNQNDSYKVRDMKSRTQKYLNKEYIDILISAIRASNENLIEKFETQFPNMDISNIRFFILAVGGLSVPAISFLNKEKTSTVYSRRERILNSIHSSTVDDKEQFLDVLKKQKKGRDN